MNSKSGVAAVDRAFTILEAFKSAGPVLSLADISRTTGLYKSTILRLMGSLEQFSYVRQLSSGTYQLGPKLAELASVFQDAFNLRDYVQPVLEYIVKETSEGASFFFRDGDTQSCLFRVDGRHTVRDHHIRVGTTWDLKRGASAKIFNRFETPGETAFTMDNFTAISLGEVNEDMAAIAVPVFGAGNAITGAIVISSPRLRFTGDNVERYRRVAMEESAKLSVALGAQPRLFDRLLEESRQT